MSESARVDFESRCDLRLGLKHRDNKGLGRYFESPHWKALIMCHQMPGAETISDWTYRDVDCPADLAHHIRTGGMIRAHNAQFERNCFDNQHSRFGWPRPRVDQYVCTAVEAAAMSLPRSLDDVGTVLNLAVQKDKRGKELIDFFSVPIRRLKRHAHLPPGPIFNEPEDHPEQFDAFRTYCRRDVETEAAVAARLFPLMAADQEMYTLDQVINSRGLQIDLESVHAALRLAAKARERLEAELLDLTLGQVTGINKSAEICAYLKKRGVETDSVAKDVVADLLELEDIPDDARRVLEIRQQGAKSSTAKLEALVERASADGRVRNAFMMNAAGPGRWTSTGAQLHNLPRPRKVFADAHLDLDVLFGAIRHGDPAYVEFLYGPQLGQPLPLLADSLKSFICAAPGHDLMEVDYSGIQNANGAWLADETWKLEAMKEIIANPKLPDMYCRVAEGIYGEPIAKGDGRRQVGKVSDLSMQFEGGVSALYMMARVYGLKLHPVFPPVWAAASEERREKACKRYERCLKRREAKADVLTREGWIAGELIKIGFRAGHPAIAGSWKLLANAMREAVANPGKQVSVLKVAYLVAHDFLFCRLPSGRAIAYPAPRLRQMVWFKDHLTGDSDCIPAEQGYAREKAGEGKVTDNAPASVTALGVDNNTREFLRYGLYGGLAFQNVVMGIEVDILRHGLKAAEREGYPAVGHIHDAGLFEPPEGFGSVDELRETMCRLPGWAAGLPLTGAGYRSKRLKKD
jgi:DNA polymerase